MKALYCIGKETVAWQEYEEGPVGPGQVRVQITHGAAKHGTEMSIYMGYHFEHGEYNPETQLCEPVDETQRYRKPMPVGNMQVGLVTAVGPGVTELRVGDRVCFYSGFRQSAIVKASACYRMPESMSWKSAVCLDPLDFALGAVRER